MTAQSIYYSKKVTNEEINWYLSNPNIPFGKHIAASLLGISIGTIDNLMKSRKISYIKSGTKVLFKLEFIKEFQERRLIKSKV